MLSDETYTPAVADDDLNKITSDQIAAAIKEAISPEVLHTVPEDKVLEQVEAKFQLPPGSLSSRREEIAAIIRSLHGQFEAQDAPHGISPQMMENDNTEMYSALPPAVVARALAITPEQITNFVRDQITPENLAHLTKRKIREALEAEFQLPVGALGATRRKEISTIISTVAAQVGAPPAVPTTAPEATPSKRQRATNDDADSYGSDDDERESDEEDEKKPRSKSSAKKKAQGAVMTKAFFTDNALPLESNLGDVKFTAQPREFATGSCGWFYGSKQPFIVGDREVMCQVTINCTVLGSKAWKEGRRAKKAKQDE